MRKLPFHAAAHASVDAPPQSVFAQLDDPLWLAAHMTRRSWMMAGSRMSIETDSGGGRVVGSTIRLHGRVVGAKLELTEVITERVPPMRKVWETVGEPKLLVIGAYRLGFEITPQGRGSDLRVFIDYARPTRGASRLLGVLLGPFYARWCVRRMVRECRRT